MLQTMTRTETLASKSSVSVEPGTSADSYAVFLVFERAYADLTQRLGMIEATSAAGGKMRCTGASGTNATLSFLLAPRWPPQIQFYSHTVEPAEDTAG